MKYAFWLSPLLASFLVIVSCETDLLEDSGFQYWCGEQLCEWDTIEGEIDRVSTWHEQDYGVELVGAPVVLTQPFARGTLGCALIETVANVDPAAEVFVAIDQDGDGTPEWERQLGTEGFEAKSWEVELDVFGDNTITLGPDPVERSVGIAIVRKNSVGEAVIARLRISTECVEDR
jgi:hypothetical protein